MSDDTKLPSPLTQNQQQAVTLEKGKKGTKISFSMKDLKTLAELDAAKKAKEKSFYEGIAPDDDSKSNEDRLKTILPDKEPVVPQYQSQKPILTGLRKLREKIFGSRKSTDNEEQIRKDLIKVGSQMANTESIIEQNTNALEEVAKNNVELANILSHISSPRQMALREKTKKGEELFPEEAGEILTYLENITAGMNKVGVSLSASIPHLIGNIQTLVNDNKIDLNTKRDMVSSLVKVVSKEKVESPALEDLKKLSEQQLNFNEKDNATLNDIFNTLKVDTNGKKIYGTMEELGKKLDTLILSEDELRKFEERKDDTDATNKENLKKKGLGALDEGVKAGLLDTVFAALGVPGLGQVLGGLGLDPTKLLGAGVGGLAGGVGKLGAKAIGALGGLGQAGGAGLAAGETAAAVTAAASIASLLLAGGAGVGLGYLAVQGLDKVTGGKFSQIVGTPGAWLADQVGKVTGGSFGSISNEDAFSEGAKLVHKPSSINPANVDTQASNLSAKLDKESRLNQSKIAEKSAQPIIINQGSSPKQTPLTPMRRSSVDDVTLAVMNTSVFE
jgi:hypothetical protein